MACMDELIQAEISAGAVRHNLRVLREHLEPGCKLCPVVKADCYGHGLKLLLPTIADAADMLAVATPAEAEAVRSLGYDGPMLCLIAQGAQAGGSVLGALSGLIESRVDLTVTDPAEVRALAGLAARRGRTARLHAKIDTGMGRSGVIPDEAGDLIAAIRQSESVRLVGVYTHFAASDAAEKTHTRLQMQRFEAILDQLGPWAGVTRHAANSAAIADLPETHLDMVRPGIAVYGYQASDELRNRLPLRPALRLTAPVVQVKTLPAGWTCGYGCTVTLDRPARVGIVPAGYNDGVSRALSGHCPVGVGATVAPVLGRVSMDQVIVDLSACPQIGVGDRVELISPDPEAPHSAANLARLGGTIPYEVTCRLGRRTGYRLVEQFEPLATPAR